MTAAETTTSGAAAGAAALGVELADAPRDGISSVVFSNASKSVLAVTSWDKTVSLYDVAENQTLARYSHKAAVLDAAFAGARDVVYSGGLDLTLKSFDLASKNEKALGSHDEAISSVEYSKETGVIMTGGWDRTVRLWDDRTPSVHIGTFAQPERVYSMSTTQNKLVVAMAARAIYVYDLRNLSEPEQRRESSLKFMTRKVACIPSGEGFATSSIEGRVAVDYFDKSAEAQAKNYSFKCHRQVVDGVDTIYPVNALAYHPVHGTFASGGSDGVVCMWDGFNKKRIKQYPRYPTSISALAFNADGTRLAVASSYAFEEGARE
nr:hypothetical protein HK105_005663 [Polyrhizophydium stewartii]